ncbi:MAG: DNA integrity scanning diadenylate cyclase DisA [Candidatus Aerophobetes bacterium]|nr:DNA integrity scanning diadenylate cyclase DisA [Candidatus Aerophobetes bacterium]
MSNNLQKEEKNLSSLLKLVSPGTVLKQGLEIILQAGTGALIVIGDTEEVLKTIDGGFEIECLLTPTALAELAKMDGAVIISKDIKRILYANTQLIPDYLIPTNERGTRHRAAERMAKQTNCPVIAISRARNTISLYQGETKYVLKTLPELTSRANQALQALERHRIVFDEILKELEILEFQEEVRLSNVIKIVQRGQMIKNIKREIDKYIIELGKEARLIKMQLKEIVGDTPNEVIQIIQDYAKRNSKKVCQELEDIEMNELLEPLNIVRILGYKVKSESLDFLVFPRGYRVLSKIPRLPPVVVKNMIKTLGDLPNIVNSDPDQLMKINEVGEKRAYIIKKELKRLKDRALIEKP